MCLRVRTLGPFLIEMRLTIHKLNNDVILARYFNEMHACVSCRKNGLRRRWQLKHGFEKIRKKATM